MTGLKRSTALSALPAVLVIGLATPIAHADVWNYVGTPFTACLPGNCDPALIGDSLNLSVTFNGSLAPDLNQALLTSSITSGTLADAFGYLAEAFLASGGTLSSSGGGAYGPGGVAGGLGCSNPGGCGYTPNLLGALISTDSSGNITNTTHGPAVGGYQFVIDLGLSIPIK